MASVRELGRGWPASVTRGLKHALSGNGKPWCANTGRVALVLPPEVHGLGTPVWVGLGVWQIHFLDLCFISGFGVGVKNVCFPIITLFSLFFKGVQLILLFGWGFCAFREIHCQFPRIVLV